MTQLIIEAKIVIIQISIFVFIIVKMSVNEKIVTHFRQGKQRLNE